MISFSIIIKMPYEHGNRKKTKTPKPIEDDKEAEQIPKSFIIKRGEIGMYLKELLHDVRNIMYPFTASKLKES